MLFLPTCKRCCAVFAARDPTFWVVPEKEAVWAFPMLQSEDGLPLRVPFLPGMYDQWIGHAGPLKLLSVRAAKEFAIKETGDQYALIGALDQRRAEGVSEWKLDRLDRLIRAPLKLQDVVPGTRDAFPRHASIPFPYVDKEGVVENGHWCLACMFTVPIGPDAIAEGRRRRAWTRAGFLEHISCCEAKSLVKEEELKEWHATSDRPPPPGPFFDSITDSAIVRWS